ncbi:MAG: hypothetical protein JO022_06570, partial [Acidobacteriaceae bacterium]|nr:hypothetical protein [Acidobacteriaceae bacterium]
MITFLRPRHLSCTILLIPFALHAQLITSTTAIPKTLLPPVVFLNGYQNDCSGSNFANTFGVFDQLLQATNRVSLFFDNCQFSGKPAIETLGNDFRDYLASLRFTDSTPVPVVDVVAHSMGGLIVRSYLAGKQTTPGMFQPPSNVNLRKVVFLATPHWGSPIASLFGLGIDTQTSELANGSQFVYDLGTWNQGTDDLRGVDALALAGNGGTGRAIATNFDDGVVSLTSASIGFAEPGRTRIVPYCHTGPGLVTLAGFCPSNAPGIAVGAQASDANATAVLSFLNGKSDWQSVGQAAEQNPLLQTGGGLEARAASANGQFASISSATASKQLNVTGNAVAWTELLPATSQDLMITSPAGQFEAKFNEPAGYVTALLVKPGPFIQRMYPAAAVPSTLAIAPGMLISIYGTGFVSTAVVANSLPFPTT